MKNLVQLKLVNSTTLLTVRYGTVRYCTILYDTVPYRHVYSCHNRRYRTFFSLFGTFILVKYDGTVPFFFIRDVYSCHNRRYRTFFLYSARLFLSNMTVPYLFSLFGTCILVITSGTVPFFFIRDVFSCQI